MPGDDEKTTKTPAPRASLDPNTNPPAPAPAPIADAIEEAAAREPTEEEVRLERVLEAWIRETINNSPLSRDTVCYNFLRETAIPDLSRRILEGE